MQAPSVYTFVTTPDSRAIDPIVAASAARESAA